MGESNGHSLLVPVGSDLENHNCAHYISGSVQDCESGLVPFTIIFWIVTAGQGCLRAKMIRTFALLTSLLPSMTSVNHGCAISHAEIRYLKESSFDSRTLNDRPCLVSASMKSPRSLDLVRKRDTGPEMMPRLAPYATERLQCYVRRLVTKQNIGFSGGPWSGYFDAVLSWKGLTNFQVSRSWLHCSSQCPAIAFPRTVSRDPVISKWPCYLTTIRGGNTGNPKTSHPKPWA